MSSYDFPIHTDSYDYDAARVAADLRALPDGARGRTTRAGHHRRWALLFGRR